MSRAGREPAEDVKRRLVAACQEVGLTIDSARMILLKERGHRVVHVGASVPGWPHECPMLSVMAYVKVTGDWPEGVDVRCVASDEDPVTVMGPRMTGRGCVPFSRLVDQLGDTLKEREEVMRLVKSGLQGPYKFERSVWDDVDLLKGVLDGIEPL